MSVISSVVNFDENLSKNLPYCNLLLEQMTGNSRSVKVCEHAAMASAFEKGVISKICEGYQFIIAFSGKLFDTAPLFEKLSACGYRFSDKSDAELALFCYIHFGEQSPGLLSGNFSYIIYDSMRRQVFAAVDDIASMPIFYAELSGGAIISSKIRSILSHPDIPTHTTGEKLSWLLSAPSKTTGNIFDKIYALPPLHILKITPGGIVTKKYSVNHKELSPKEIVSEMLFQSPEKISAIYTGAQCDLRLLQLITEAGTPTQMTVYSGDYHEIFKELSVKWQRLSFCEESILTSLEQIVRVCGMPQMTGGDFVMSGVLRRFCCAGELIFTAFSANPESCSYEKVLRQNNAYHPQVMETLCYEEPSCTFALNTPQILADSCEVRQCSPFMRTKGGFSVPESAKIPLRHILLSIISKDTSPVLAFFKSSSLLRLCEGGFELSGLSESQLISYIIKLNIWLEKYRPSIL